MTNAELIATIRNEIERRITDNTFGAKLELIDILAWLDTIESEKPMNQDEGLNEEIKKEMVKLPFFIRGKDQIAFARHFAEWGYLRAAEKYNEIEYNRQRAEEEDTPKDLEEAAWDCVLDSVDVNNPVLLPKYKVLLTSLFIAGAKWQEKQNLRFVKQVLSGDFTVFEAGRKYERKQMLKEAVEGEYDFYPAAVYLDVPIPRMNHGDKVRVIVCKKED